MMCHCLTPQPPFRLLLLLAVARLSGSCCQMARARMRRDYLTTRRLRNSQQTINTTPLRQRSRIGTMRTRKTLGEFRVLEEFQLVKSLHPATDLQTPGHLGAIILGLRQLVVLLALGTQWEKTAWSFGKVSIQRIYTHSKSTGMD